MQKMQQRVSNSDQVQKWKKWKSGKENYSSNFISSLPLTMQHKKTKLKHRERKRERDRETERETERQKEREFVYL